MQSELLDVVIGVVFVWFLLSMVLSAVNEALSLATHVRAKHLWLGIGRLLDPERSPLPRRLLDIGVIVPFWGSLDLRPLARRPDGQPWQPSSTSEDALEDAQHLTANAFDKKRSARIGPDLATVRVAAQGLYDALGPGTGEIAKPGRRSKLTNVDAGAFADAVVTSARAAHGSSVSSADEPNDVDTLAVLRFLEGNPHLADAVRRAASAAGVEERVEAVKATIAEWFDREMNDLSRYYRRQSRKILLLLSIPLVLFTHANTITIFEDLREDSALRAAAVGAAGDAVAAGFDPSGCTTTSTSSTTSSTTTSAPPTTSSTVSIEDVRERFQCAADVLESAEQFRVGLAWQELIETRGRTGENARFDPEDDLLPYLGSTLRDDWGWVGRAITVVALAFGAQFWFDVLKRLVGLRQAAAK